jgi:hypothetical protein
MKTQERRGFKLLRQLPVRVFARFHTKRGIYAMVVAQLDAVIMDVIDWWSTYGSETPELAEVAKKVLSQLNRLTVLQLKDLGVLNPICTV